MVPVALGTLRIIASTVASGYDDHDAGLPCGFRREAQWIAVRGFEYRPAQRKVQHADVVLVLEKNRREDGLDDTRIRSVPVGVERTQVDEVRTGRHADIDAARTVRADNAGNVSSVAVSVACAAADE